jgi:hypothetical protein
MIRDWRDSALQYDADQPNDAGAAAQPVVVVQALWDSALGVDALAGIAFSTLAVAGGGAEHNITGAGGIASLAAVGAPTVEAVFPQVLGGGAPWTRPAPLLEPLPWFVHGAGGIASRSAVGVPTVTWRRVTRARRESELLLFAKAA